MCPFVAAAVVGVDAGVELATDIKAGVGRAGGESAAVTLAAVVAILEHIFAPRMDEEQNVFSLSAFGDDTSTCKEDK